MGSHWLDEDVDDIPPYQYLPCAFCYADIADLFAAKVIKKEGHRLIFHPECVEFWMAKQTLRAVTTAYLRQRHDTPDE